MSSYDESCGQCYYLRDMDNDKKMFCGSACDKGHCIMLKGCYYPDDSTCHYFKDKDKYSPFWGYYITTAVCELLSIGEDSDIMNKIKFLRNEVMQNNEKYQDVLKEYDTVGPKIAKELREDRDYELALGMLNFYIIPTVTLVNEHEYDQAVSKYKTMTDSLRDYYGITDSISVNKPKVKSI